MKKILLTFYIFIFLYMQSFAMPFDDFNKYYTSNDLLEPFVKDFGGVIGASDSNTAKKLSVFGLDLGFDLAVQNRPSSDNKILINSDVDGFGVPRVHMDFGLPVANLDVSVRGFSYSNLKVIGGGLKYSLFKTTTQVNLMPDISPMAYYDIISYDYFTGYHISVDVVASWNLPNIKPYISFGYDNTSLKVRNIGYGFDGNKASSSGLRGAAGIRFSPVPLVYIYGGYNIINGEGGYNFGFGMEI
ncbi:MAG: hypothetical protein KA059_06045 [Elusimicrobiales bacterium]|jgi:hypothetical protein|nr:hypothetical protein [Elusimicrobiales bacterium]